MHGIAVAIIAGSIIFTGSLAYLSRYEIVEGGSSASYRLHDRWTHRMTYCVRTEARRSELPDLDCTSWGPLVGGQP